MYFFLCLIPLVHARHVTVVVVSDLGLSDKNWAVLSLNLCAALHVSKQVLIDDRLYGAILLSLEQTHCARM